MTQILQSRSGQNSDPTIHSVVVSNLSKRYKLYPNPKARLREALSLSGKTYHKDFFALKSVSFEVPKGQILGIIGKNGSGKSTLLKIIAGVLQPTEGSVRADGAVSALLELGSGFNPDFTGIENAYFYGSILGFPRSFMDARISEIIGFADIGEFIHQPLKKYSSGMKARLAFAVAINVDPDILILDEVLAVGDELFRRKCYARMEEFMKGQKTILFVTHSLPNVIEICDRAILLDSGELILNGEPSEVAAQYQRFLHSTPAVSEAIRNEILALHSAHHAYSQSPPIESNKGAHVPALEHKVSDSDSRTDRLSLLPFSKDSQTRALRLPTKAKPFYIPDLLSKARLEYRAYEVDIRDVAMKTLRGEPVNALLMGESYIYAYEVEFHIDARNVRFGMMFKTEKGLNLCSGSLPGRFEFLDQVKSGEKFYIEWQFDCLFLPGTYFTNAGVSSTPNGEEMVFLNRVVDALVFKVQDLPRLDFRGLVYAGQSGKIAKL